MSDHTWYQRPPHVPEHDSAGGVVVRIEDNCIYFACIGEPGLSGHVLPKGRVDPGETFEQAARREIAEEAGQTRLTLLDFLGTHERLDDDKRSWKRIHYFLFVTDQSNGRPTDPLHEGEVKWFPLDELPEMLWPEQRQLMEENRERIVTWNQAFLLS
ncbi:MAG: NUDIX domain-containing protein [candidate division KSB1 bacterium]|nr:NUDIX domain-containing protein [candidate division KSB1 bacterium]MDZ7275911.1 NUDIX domain-containing protein [candidate division KSB1 bacterium]MDZ7285807.1 NUDIX domain-containing protein [candidate division KSB1 bacterium]MDZ7298839.1 NUDIX domain-containing protein [candidate division KSB1 bacterium]MDZ7308860.1 NUDIX domain-containing protein [candidate division KSB1 bacterium]